MPCEIKRALKDKLFASASAPEKEQQRNTMISSCPGITSKLALGAGCYWGTEKYVKIDFQKKFPNSIKNCAVGFMSPDPANAMKNPSYRDVCSGRSGHIEVLDIELNDPEAHYEELIRFFFQFHDPTTKDRQGNDSGFQYASFVFTSDEEQKKITDKVMKELQGMIDGKKLKKAGYQGDTVTTGVGEYNTFVTAHEEHQEYLMKNPGGYCNHRIRYRDWPLN